MKKILIVEDDQLLNRTLGYNLTSDGKSIPYSFPFLQMGLFVLALFGLEILLSLWTMGRQKKQSLVEEMHSLE